ncbi:MAG: polymer-forming cytoskeletal protein [Candidatus Komeilibacteria bacterium]|nr:polymer-forming cytoskeletal protein [Candidatus Komeilibacteria bacterium]
MFKSEESGKNQTTETIIGQSVKVEGDFVGEGDVVVEGIVIGNLKTKNNLRVGPQAKIEAKVEAENAQIAGEVSGNITVSQFLEIKASAKITGDVNAGIIAIEKGAKINGRILMGEAIKTSASATK